MAHFLKSLGSEGVLLNELGDRSYGVRTLAGNSSVHKWCVVVVRCRILLKGGKPSIQCVTEDVSNVFCAASVQDRVLGTEIRFKNAF